MSVDKGKVYDELLKLSIDLNFEDIPTPSYIQDKILDCNEYQRKVEKFFIEATRELSQKERLFRCEKLNIEVKKRQTLTNNEKIKRIPTGKEREAAVDELLEQDYQNLLNLENDVCALKDLLTAIRTVQANLKSTNSDIRVLAKVMEQQINRLNVGSKDDPEIRGLNKTLSDLNKLELEEEMTVDDVESTSEAIQPDEPDDESASESLEKVSSAGDGQGTSTEVDPDDVVSSFLVDDSSDFLTQSTGDETREGDSPTEDSGEVSTITDTSEESKGDSPPDEGPKVDLNLEDLGIDIDMGDAVTEAKAPPPTNAKGAPLEKPPPAKSPAKATPEAVPEGNREKVTVVSKKEEKPASTGVKKQDVTDVNIDDILNSL